MAQDTNDSVVNSIYRVLGDEISDNFNGVWGGVIGAKEGILHLNHEDFDIEAPLEVHNGAFFGDRQWAGVFDERTGYHNTVPGKVFITFIDSIDGKIYHTQRNIDYGSLNGNQMFLIDIQQLSHLQGDYDLDGDADGSDLSNFLIFFSSGNSKADLNNDGLIDGQDLALFAFSFGSCPFLRW